MQSAFLALKGTALVAALAANSGKPLVGELSAAMRQLLRLLVTTMAANPLQFVRNAAYYALDAVLGACSVRTPRCTLPFACMHAPHGHAGL